MQANFAASTGFRCVFVCALNIIHNTPELECIFSSGTNMKILVAGLDTVCGHANQRYIKLKPLKVPLGVQMFSPKKGPAVLEYETGWSDR